jgi:hypothetical protein
MRIRQVKPSFFKDPLMAELSPAVRLFYVGLWMLADDAGWFRWDPAEVGNELYGYEPRGRRERHAADYLDTLVSAKRVTRFDCGHVFIPTLTDHQRLAGLTKQVRTVVREHEKECSPQPPAGPRDAPQSPDPVRNGIGKGTGTVDGTERNGIGTESAPARAEAGPREDETESDFRKRTGIPVFMGELSEIPGAVR